MKKRLFMVGAVLALITLIVISGCSKKKVENTPSTTEVDTKNVRNPKGVGRVYYDLFDTVSYIYSYKGECDTSAISNKPYRSFL